MNEEILLKIEEIYHKALELPAKNRSSFLADACGDNVELLKEVKSLLSFAEKESSLIDTPPMDVAAEIFSNDEHSDLIGKEIEQYKITSHLGTGGMGEVFLAEDSKLERLVAIKFIKAEIAQMPEQLQRFLQEAKTASALNHPNIITVYEIGETNETQFIATEYIEGKTLRKVISEDSLSLNKTLDIISQIITAVNAAHKAEIIHRDIKPENIMVREDGLVKVLDFGLAKLQDTETRLIVEMETRKHGDTDKKSLAPRLPISLSTHLTQTGLMMGTIAYMSPEQARIETIDKRSDIWSIGVLLYEICSGEKPFAGETAEETIDAILNRQPKPLVTKIPFELSQIIEKALQKDVDKRYQTAEEFLQDINSLQKDFSGEDEVLKNSLSSNKQQLTSSDKSRVSSPTNLPTNFNGYSEKREISSAEYVFSEVKKRKVFSVSVIASFILAIVVGGYFYNVTNSESDNSVAVLPFVNEIGDSDMDYLSDGISESLIDSLSQLSGVKVIARGSTFKYKGKELDSEEIASSLGVKFILSGRIAQRGDDLQIIAELIDVSDKSRVWGEQFNRKMADLSEVESEISKKIIEQMKVHLTNNEQQQIASERKPDPKAYQLFLKGKFYQSKSTKENANKAIDYFKQAVAIDSNYTKAYAALAHTYSYMGANSFLDPKESMPKAKEAIQKALELNENVAEVHHTLAGIKRSEWDWTGAEQEYKRAIELNPNLATVYFSYAFYLSTQGRLEEAISIIKKGRELDPLKPNIYPDVAVIYYFARQYDLAKEEYETGLEFNPNYSGNQYGLGFVNTASGNYLEAIKYYKKTAKLLDINHTGVKCYLGFAMAKAGQIREARSILKELETGKEYVSPVELAMLYVGLGEQDKAIDSLEKGYLEHDSQMQFLGVEPHFDGLRQDPRFIDLMRRVGLSPENYQ